MPTTKTNANTKSPDIPNDDIGTTAMPWETEELEVDPDLYEFIRQQTQTRRRANEGPCERTRNLLVEITEKLGEAGLGLGHIACVTNRDGSDNIDVSSFLETARRFEYDPGYGSEKVPPDLVLMLTDGTWLERVTDDGAEWFEHKKPPKVTARPRTVSDWNQAPYAARNGVAAFFRG